VGEKYDDECGYGYERPQIYGARRIVSPFGEGGFSSADLDRILGGGAEGVATFERYGMRPAATLGDAVRSAAQTMRGAPADSASQAQAAHDAATGLDQGLARSSTQVDQAMTVYQIANQAGSMPEEQVLGAGRRCVRALQAAGGEDLSFLGRVGQDLVDRAEDAAVGAAGSRLEAVANRVNTFASTTADRMFRGIERQAPGDAPDAGSAA
jgi:hypothetical protein